MIDKWSIKFNLAMCLREVIDKLDSRVDPAKHNLGAHQACYFLQRAAALLDEILIQTKQVEYLNKEFWERMQAGCGEDLQRFTLSAQKDIMLANVQSIQFKIISVRAASQEPSGGEMRFVLSGMAKMIS